MAAAFSSSRIRCYKNHAAVASEGVRVLAIRFRLVSEARCGPPESSIEAGDTQPTESDRALWRMGSVREC